MSDREYKHVWFTQRVRVNFMLPCNLRKEEIVIDLAKEILKGFGAGGFTYSNTRPPNLHGYYYDQDKGAWAADSIVWLFCDVKRELEADRGEKFEHELCAIYNNINEQYKKVGSEQAEVWITVHPITVMYNIHSTAQTPPSAPQSP